MRAEFWIEGIGEEYGTDTTESGSYLYLATDQARFYPIDASANYSHAYGGGCNAYRNIDYRGEPSEPIPLEQIPAFVSTEIMRDADKY